VRGKIAIVTGASRGIGKAIALGYAREGAAVVVAARSETAPSERLPGSIHETVEQIEALGGRAIAVRCDVTDEGSVNAMVQAALVEFGRVDVLVNNAAVDFPSKVADMQLKRWEVVFRVGLTGPFLCCRAVLPAMIERGGGSIVNISSQAGSERGTGTVGYSAAYAATKA
jgi:citronellol/citronellal dehydrogenase